VTQMATTSPGATRIASAHDAIRNPHRDPRGWAYSAVNSMLRNETYTGRRVWAKQRKFEQLIDPKDVGAGQPGPDALAGGIEWVRSEMRTHPALLSDELFAEVRGLMETPRTTARKPRTSTHKYVLRGVLFCAHCGRRMEGAWRPTAETTQEGPCIGAPCGTAAPSHRVWQTTPGRSTSVRTPSCPHLTAGSNPSSPRTAWSAPRPTEEADESAVCGHRSRSCTQRSRRWLQPSRAQFCRTGV
jgi:hypothetical protein